MYMFDKNLKRIDEGYSTFYGHDVQNIRYLLMDYAIFWYFLATMCVIFYIGIDVVITELIIKQ